MIAVVQRVSGAKLRVDGADKASIGPGLFVLLGVEQRDAETDAAYIAGKVAGMRIFERDNKMNDSVADIGGEVLLVSQFTLCGDARKGRRPDFTAAAPPQTAEALYERVATLLREAGLPVQTGVFGADMQIDAACDGPVTIMLNSNKLY